MPWVVAHLKLVSRVLEKLIFLLFLPVFSLLLWKGRFLKVLPPPSNRSPSGFVFVLFSVVLISSPFFSLDDF